jgi:hypothetical protein
VNYIASISDFFKSPKWMMNLLLAGVCAFIPIVGPLVVMGWLVHVFWVREDENYATYPDFDFGNFKEYLERGLWPFVVTFAASIVMVPIMMIVLLPMTVIGSVISGHEGEGVGCFGVIAWLITMFLYVLLLVLMSVVLTPLHLRATIVQDFGKSFDFGFMKRFVGLMWKEIVIAWIFLGAASVVFGIVGMLVFCIGVYFAMVPIYFAWAHLSKQLYTLYLSRGGDPIPVSAKLIGPPPIPGG